MQNELSARLDQMLESAESIGSSATKIREAVQQTDSEVRALGEDRYVSPGATAFRAQYFRLTPRLNQAADELLKFQNKLIEAEDEIRVFGLAWCLLILFF
jgi:uncharacterized protein YukE